MRTVLHIFTREDELGFQLAEQQRALPDTKVEVVVLNNATDYNAVLDQIFAADSVEAW